MLPDSTERGQQVIAIVLAMISFATFTVFARWYTRFFILHNIGKDDYLILISWVSAAVSSGFMVYQAINGLGHHITDLQPDQLTLVLKSFFLSIPFYYISLSLTKISIVLQTLRVVTPAHRRTRLACYIMLGLIVGYLLYTTITSFLLCIPASYFWDKTIEGSCMNFLALWFVNAALNIVTDIAILVIPLKVILSLQLARKQKVCLVVIFALGGVACIVSVLRLQSLYVVSISTDPTYDNVPAAYWSNLEMTIAIICACLPTLRPMVSRIFPSLLPGSYGPRSKVNTSTLHTLGSPTKDTFEHQLSNLHTVVERSTASEDSKDALKEIRITTHIRQDYAATDTRPGSEHDVEGVVKDKEYV